MSTSLDSILSGASNAAPEQENTEEQVTQSNAAVAQQEMDHGDGSDTQVGDAQAQADDGSQRTVPHQALHAEKQKVKRYTEEVSSLRQEIADRDAAWERRIAQLIEANRPKQEAPPKPDFFENPEAAVRATAQEYADPRFSQINQTLMANAQMLASIKYGDEKVAAAEEAFSRAYQAGKLDPADADKVMKSANIYAAAVQWHQSQQAKAEIGDDPAAYRERVKAEIRKELEAEFQQGAAPPAQQAAPVMPSNHAAARNVGSRSGPAWSGPSPLQDIFDRRPLNG